MVLFLGGCCRATTPTDAPIAAAPCMEAPLIRHAYAVYDSENRLIRSPIEPFLAEEARRKAEGARPITDVYVVSHGWNFTLEESGQLYENYVLAFQSTLAEVAVCDKQFEPFFIFISWSSVTRPIGEALRSLLPIDLPEPVDWALDRVDSVAFHIPSNWGETDDAQHIALGGARRRQDFAPSEAWLDPRYSEYQSALQEGAGKAGSEAFEGYEIPVSVLLDELLRIPARGAFAPYKTHVVGHSFGSKVAALATFDVASRRFAAEQCRSAGHSCAETVVDSLTLINAALRPPELYNPPHIIPPATPSGEVLTSKLAETLDDKIVPFESAATLIRRKSVAYTEHDSATGWLFSLANLVLNYDAIAETRFTELWPSWLYLPAFVADSAVVALKTISIDAWVFVSRPIAAVGDVLTETDSVGDLLKNVGFIPLSPFAALKGVGNQGFENMAAIRFLPTVARTTWLTSSAAEYLEQSTQVDAERFAYLSGGLFRKPPDAGDHFDVYDASTVYNGHIGDATGPSAFLLGIGNQLPPGAHGDIRSYAMVRGVEKRRRTFHWIYNLTRFGYRECEAH